MCKHTWPIKLILKLNQLNMKDKHETVFNSSKLIYLYLSVCLFADFRLYIRSVYTNVDCPLCHHHLVSLHVFSLHLSWKQWSSKLILIVNIRRVRLEAALCRMLTIWHQSTARTIRKHRIRLLSYRSRGIWCHTVIILCSAASSRTRL